MMRDQDTTAGGTQWDQAWPGIAEVAIRRGIDRLIAHNDHAREDVVQDALCRLLAAARPAPDGSPLCESASLTLMTE